MQCPLLSYNDNTYISVRDIAKLISKDIEWSEGSKEITLKQPDEEKQVIKKAETALAIGKAVAEDYYLDYVDENSFYYVTYLQPTADWADCVYEVHILFNATDDEKNDLVTLLNVSNVVIIVDPIDGNIIIKERQKSGDLQEINK